MCRCVFLVYVVLYHVSMSFTQKPMLEFSALYIIYISEISQVLLAKAAKAAHRPLVVFGSTLPTQHNLVAFPALGCPAASCRCSATSLKGAVKGLWWRQSLFRAPPGCFHSVLRGERSVQLRVIRHGNGGPGQEVIGSAEEGAGGCLLIL